MPNRDRDPLTGVPPSRHPFQFWILAACFVGGVSTAFGAGPATIRDLVPHWAFFMWGLILMFGGGMGLIASFLHDRITGLLWERTALMAIGGGSFIYSAVLITTAGQIAYVTAAYTCSVGIAALWRIRHINRALATLTRWIDHNYSKDT